MDEDPLVVRFRSASNERLSKIEASWIDLTRATAKPDSRAVLERELHTLKGDARVLEFSEVAELCEHLEQIVFRVRERDFRVHDEVDIAVTMALQFIAVLVRKEPGEPITGIDLADFSRHLRKIITELPSPSKKPPGVDTTRRLRVLDSRVPEVPLRGRIDAVAGDLFIEALRSTGEHRERLLQVFARLVHESADLDAVPLQSILEKHEGAAIDLATSLGKSVVIASAPSAPRIDPEVAACIDVIALHALRNAIDHGIEPATIRTSRGKPAAGTITLRADIDRSHLSFEVRDDGAGIDLAVVAEQAKARAITTGSGPEALLELLFTHGFSTREETSTISGRGFGISAARACARALGGEVTLRTEPGRGTVTAARIPLEPATHPVHLFERSPGLFLAISAECVLTEARDTSRVADPAARLLLAPPGKARCHAVAKGPTLVPIRLGEQKKTTVGRFAGVAAEGAPHRPMRTPLGYVLYIDPERLVARAR